MSATEAASRESRARIRAYVERVCLPDVADEAASAAFADFVARADARSSDEKLDVLLLQGTRSAAASRFAVAVPMGHPELALSAECRAMPELLAAHANGESPGDEQLIADHLVDCAVCAHTLNRMQSAEQAFAAATGERPALEVQETRVDTSRARARPAPPAPPTRPPAPSPANPQASPQPESPSRIAAAAEVPSLAGPRRRSGGLVGALRRFGRPQRG